MNTPGMLALPNQLSKRCCCASSARTVFQSMCVISQVYDVRALRLVVSSKRDCYAALRHVTRLWPCVLGRFKV